jgi:hypothetical protein
MMKPISANYRQGFFFLEMENCELSGHSYAPSGSNRAWKKRRYFGS